MKKLCTVAVCFALLGTLGLVSPAQAGEDEYQPRNACGALTINVWKDFVDGRTTTTRDILVGGKALFTEALAYVDTKDGEKVVYIAHVHEPEVDPRPVADSPVYGDAIIALGEAITTLRTVLGRQETGNEWACLWRTSIVRLPY